MVDGPGPTWQQGPKAWLHSSNLVPCMQRSSCKPLGSHFRTCVTWMHCRWRYILMALLFLKFVQVQESVKGSELSLMSVPRLERVRSRPTTSMLMGWTLRVWMSRSRFTFRGEQVYQDSLICGSAPGERRRWMTEILMCFKFCCQVFFINLWKVNFYPLWKVKTYKEETRLKVILFLCVSV